MQEQAPGHIIWLLRLKTRFSPPPSRPPAQPGRSTGCQRWPGRWRWRRRARRRCHPWRWRHCRSRGVGRRDVHQGERKKSCQSDHHQLQSSAGCTASRQPQCSRQHNAQAGAHLNAWAMAVAAFCHWPAQMACERGRCVADGLVGSNCKDAAVRSKAVQDVRPCCSAADGS